MDRALGDINRSLATREDRICLCQLGGVASVLKLLVLSVGESGVAASANQWKLPLKLVLGQSHRLILSPLFFFQDIFSGIECLAEFLHGSAGELPLSGRLQQSCPSY